MAENPPYNNEMFIGGTLSEAEIRYQNDQDIYLIARIHSALRVRAAYGQPHLQQSTTSTRGPQHQNFDDSGLAALVAFHGLIPLISGEETDKVGQTDLCFDTVLTLYE